MNLPIGTRRPRPSGGKEIVRLAILLPAFFCIQCDSQVSQLDTGAIQPIHMSHIEFLEQCLANYHKQQYRDYRCTVVKQERLGGTVRAEQEVLVKFRDSPFSVAMEWVRNPDLSDRLLYVEGKYGNQMLVRPLPLFQLFAGKTAIRDPNGEDARAHSLRTVDQFGFERGMKALLEVYRLAKRNGDLQEETGRDANVLGRKAFVLIRILPQKKEYPAWKTVTYVDREWLVPILVEAYGWREGEFLCRYVYKDVKFNTGLTDDDFLPEKNDLQSP